MAIRTDLACEAYELHKSSIPDGIRQEEEMCKDIRVVTVTIETDDAGAAIGKPAGRYVTVETPPFSGANGDADEAAEIIARQISRMLPDEDERGTVLVAGLGNRDITPDALGPLTAGQVISTRHIGGDAKKRLGLEKFNSVAVISPGVLAQTGIETGELIEAVAARLEPSAVIVVDALAAMELSRLGRTVQICDSGISPGSGVCNSRRRIDEALLGTKVISVGVPTVVDAATLAEELTGVENIRETDPQSRRMMVTPREIDVIIGRAAGMIAMGINRALHPEVPPEELRYLAG